MVSFADTVLLQVYSLSEDANHSQHYDQKQKSSQYPQNDGQVICRENDQSYLNLSAGMV